MGVIKKTLFLLSGLSLFACSIKQDAENPNASLPCNPTTAQITAFKTDVFDAVFVTQGCVSCHNGSNGPPIFIANPTTEEQNKTNFCSAYRRGQLSPTVAIYNYPQTEDHGPTDATVHYPATSLANLRTWILNVTAE